MHLTVSGWCVLQLIEEFLWKAYDLLAKLDQLREVLSNPELPDDLQGAKVLTRAMFTSHGLRIA